MCKIILFSFLVNLLFISFDSKADYPSGLLSHGDFETGAIDEEFQKPHTESEWSFETSNPLRGSRSLKASTLSYKYIRYVSHDFSENGVRLENINLSGLIAVDGLINVKIRVEYEDYTYSEGTEISTTISDTNGAVPLSLDLTPYDKPENIDKEVKRISIYFRASGEVVDFVIDDIQLQITSEGEGEIIDSDYPSGLLSHGDFETGALDEEFQKPHSESEWSFETSNPLRGSRSLRASTSNYKYVRYVSHGFSENGVRLENINLSGLIAVDGLINVKIRAEYEDYTYSEGTEISTTISDTNGEVPLSLDLTPYDKPENIDKEVKRISIYFRASGEAVDFVIDDIQIQITEKNEKPTVSATAPTANQEYTTTQFITATAIATDTDGGVEYVEFKLSDSSSWVQGAFDGDLYTYNFGAKPAGPYTIDYRAIDDDGEESDIKTVEILVNEVEIIESDYPSGLLSHGDFETGALDEEFQKPHSESEWSFETSYPLRGSRSLKASTLSYKYIRYVSHDFSENGVRLENINLSGLIAVEGLINVKIRAEYEDYTYSEGTEISTAISDTNGEVPLSLVLTPYDKPENIDKEVKRISIYFRASGEAVDFVIDDIQIQITEKNEKPTVSAITPSINEEFLTTANVIANAGASDSDGSIARVEFKLDGGSWIQDTSSPYQYNFGNLTAASHTISFRAIDNDGLASDITSRNISVSLPNVKPTVSATAPTASQEFLTTASVIASAGASDSDGSIARVEFKLDGGGWIQDTSSPYQYNFGNLTAASHTISFRAIDNDGLASDITSRNISVSLPNVKPTVSATAPTASQEFLTTANVIANAGASDSDGSIARVEFKLDGGSWIQDTSSPYQYNFGNLTAASHTIYYRSVDNEGLESDVDSKSFTVIAALNPPPPTNIKFQYEHGFERATLTWDRYSSNCEEITIYYSQSRQDLEEGRGEREDAFCNPNEHQIKGLTSGTWYFALTMLWWQEVCFMDGDEEVCEDEALDTERSEIVSLDIDVNMILLSDFENGFGYFEEDDGINWIIHSGPTPSSNTGPARAKQGDYYAYMETSSCCQYSPGDTLTLPTHLELDENLSYMLIFDYNMYGADVGTLRVDIYGTGGWETVWSTSGQQSGYYHWREALVEIRGAREIRFTGIAAGGELGDIALDNVRLVTRQGARRILFIHTDLLGSPVAETDENGTLQGGQ